jgi:hypothetical protein
MNGHIGRILALLVAIHSATTQAQDQQLCRHLATEAARQSARDTAEKLRVEIPTITSESVVADIASNVCASVDQTNSTRVKEFASAVSSMYFTNAVQLGKSAEIASLTDGVISHDFGLGLDDLRRYGTLTVSCAYAAARVEVRGSLMSCEKRTLLDRGALQIRVTGPSVALCTAATTLGERQELVCDCGAQLSTPSIPLIMTCK